MSLLTWTRDAVYDCGRQERPWALPLLPGDVAQAWPSTGGLGPECDGCSVSAQLCSRTGLLGHDPHRAGGGHQGEPRAAHPACRGPGTHSARPALSWWEVQTLGRGMGDESPGGLSARSTGAEVRARRAQKGRSKSSEGRKYSPTRHMRWAVAISTPRERGHLLLLSHRPWPGCRWKFSTRKVPYRSGPWTKVFQVS